jgi:quinol monooxygenase YgiN
VIICTVRIQPKPSAQEKFLQAFRTITPLVRKEPGCLEYRLLRDVETEGRFFLFERWDSRQCLETHLKTPHMLDYFQATRDVFAVPDQVEVFEIQI